MIREEKYFVITSYGTEELSNKVTTYLQTGWNLYGDPYTLDTRTGTLVCQAVVVYDTSCMNKRSERL